jgi:nucleoside-diphosphate-sugar epimerase
MTRVLVTGANGFVGAAVCARLLEAGCEVRAAVRSTRAVGDLPRGVEPHIVQGISTAAHWAEAVAGVDAVVHLIARTHVMRETARDALAEYRAVNVTGTEALLDACVRAGVSRFVYLSSVKAVGEGGESAYSEQTRCAPEDEYGISKLEAEQRVVARCTSAGIDHVILRPPLVYGPRVRGNFLRLLRAVERGYWLPLGMVENRRSMVYVGNLASAVLAVLRQPAGFSGTFHVADPEALSTAELVRRLATMMRRPARILPIPPALLRAGGRLLRREAEVDRLVGSLELRADAIRQSAGWVPPYTADEGLQATVQWYGSTEKS